MAVTHEMGELVRSELKYHPPLVLDSRRDNFVQNYSRINLCGESCTYLAWKKHHTSSAILAFSPTAHMLQIITSC